MGSEKLTEKINQIRFDVLSTKIDYSTLADEILSMRTRMRSQFESKNPKLENFHLKHSPGGMIDIEFLVQYLVLKHAHDNANLLKYSDNIRQLESLATCGIMSVSDSQELIQSYITLREHAHLLSLRTKEPIIEHSLIEGTQNIVMQHWKNSFKIIE